MKKSLWFISVGLILLSCNEDAEQKSVDMHRFTMRIPQAWTVEEVQGYDSFVRLIRISDRETIGIDLGWYSSSLNVSNITHHISYTAIDGKSAKIVKPKNPGLGTTGVYFDSLDHQKTRLQMSGDDLSSENQRQFLNAIETIRFK